MTARRCRASPPACGSTASCRPWPSLSAGPGRRARCKAGEKVFSPDRSSISVRLAPANIERIPKDTTMQNTEEIWRLVDARKSEFEDLSDRVWHMPELAYT